MSKSNTFLALIVFFVNRPSCSLSNVGVEFMVERLCFIPFIITALTVFSMQNTQSSDNVVKSPQMDISPLDIKLIRQDPNSFDCLRACALMVFKYYREDISKTELWKKLHIYKKHSGLRGGYFIDLGNLALELGYKCKIQHYSWRWWNKDVARATTKTKKALVSALKELKKDKKFWASKKVINKEISFVKNDGKITMSIPKLKTIDYYLMQKIPVLISVSTRDFYQNPHMGKVHHNHIIAIVGKKGENYITRDPFYSKNKLNKDDLMFSWFRPGGWMLVILPKKQKPKAPKVRQAKLRF